MTAKTTGPERALFLLTDTRAGERFHHVLGDLVDAGLNSATLLHVLESKPHGGDPFLEEVSAWGRRFEATGVRRVSVALKRGDPAAWVRELSAITPGQWVVAATPRATPEGFLRPASPWRNLAAPVLLVPETRTPQAPPLFERVLVAVKEPEGARAEVGDLVASLPFVRAWRGLHMHVEGGEPARPAEYPIPLSMICGDRYDIADNLLAAARQGVSLLLLFAQPEDADPSLPAGYVIEAVVRGSEVPVLLWPRKGVQG